MGKLIPGFAAAACIGTEYPEMLIVFVPVYLAPYPYLHFGVFPFLSVPSVVLCLSLKYQFVGEWPGREGWKEATLPEESSYPWNLLRLYACV